MLLLGIYIGGFIATALSCLGASMDKGGPCNEFKGMPFPGRILGLLGVLVMCLFWPVSMIWMLIELYLENK